MKRAFTTNIEHGIAKVLFDLPERNVNVFTVDVLNELEDVLDNLQTSAHEIRGVVFLSGKESTFIAGADVDLIESIQESAEAVRLARRGQAVLKRLEGLPVPVIAAVHGACLGGGLEFALACTYRVVSDSHHTVLGLPEVQLGIIPGFGGTQRLPKIVGNEEALRLITSGARIFPKKAFRIGLVDDVVVRENLMKSALRLISAHPPGSEREALRRHRLTPKRLFFDATGIGMRLLFNRARQRMEKTTGGHYPAPLYALEAMEAGLLHGLERGFEIEANRVGELVVSPVSKNLMRIFRLKERFSRGDMEAARHISRMGVIGAGTMGLGICALAAEKGIWVRLINMSPRRLGMALKKLQANVEKRRKRGVLTEVEASWVPARVTYDTAIQGLGSSHVVIEAVAERMDVKTSVLGDVAKATRGDALIASNTSSLSISELARSLPNPQRFAGMHFFNPADKMPLVEIIRGEKTSDETVSALSGLARRFGKVPVEVSDRPGFLVNRLLMFYLNEAAELLGEGASVAAIDTALQSFGMPMGAFILLDVIGIDIAAHAAENLYRGFGARLKPSPILARMIEAGRMGQKSGAGFYRYDKRGKRTEERKLSQVLSGLIAKPKEIAASEIQRRLIYAMVNEAARCLEEGVVAGPEVVDIAMILGAGFPPYTGGLLWFADAEGLGRIMNELSRFASDIDERFAPSGLLKSLVEQGMGFYDHEMHREEVAV